MSNASTTADNPPAEKRKSVWPFALLALLISIVWAGGYLLANIRDVPRGDGTPFGNGEALGYMMGSTLPPTFVTWLLFYLIVFRKRGSFAKALAVFGIMVLSTEAVVVAPLAALMSSAQNDAVMQRALHETTEANIAALNRHMQTEMLDLQMPQNPLDGIHTAADVDISLERVHRARAIFERYTTSVNAEMAATRQRIVASRLSQREKETSLQALDTETAEGSPMRRNFALAESAADNTEALLVLLKESAGHWREQSGHFIFDTQETLDRFNTLAAAHDRLVQQLQAARRELSASEGSAITPTGSDPPPRQ